VSTWEEAQVTDAEPVQYTVTNGVAHIELNRPDFYNAVDLTLALALASAVERAQGDESVRAVLLSGRGPAFCAGGDVKAMASAVEPAATIAQLAWASHRAVMAMDALEKPLIAAVHGSAAGAGLGYVCAADLVLAGASAKFLSAFIGIGVTPDSGTSWYLPQIVGLHRALELTLLNRVLTARQALDWGLVTRVEPDDEVLDAAVRLASRLAAGPASALGRTRRLVRQAQSASLADHLDAEASSIASMVTSEDARGLIAAFAGR
jgi:2-(1,2-epoxy-1,2-dihydrophenyl)acetyl-CoA isomerase